MDAGTRSFLGEPLFSTPGVPADEAGAAGGHPAPGIFVSQWNQAGMPVLCGRAIWVERLKDERRCGPSEQFRNDIEP